MVTMLMPKSSFLDPEYEMHAAFDSEEDFLIWKAKFPNAKILRTSKTHRNGYEIENISKITV